jgi:hypothetical protein
MDEEHVGEVAEKEERDWLIPFLFLLLGLVIGIVIGVYVGVVFVEPPPYHVIG